MLIHALYITILAIATTFALPACAEDPRGGQDTEVILVPTFHCIGIYWSPAGGGAEHQVLVKYRRSGQQAWHKGLPLRYHPSIPQNARPITVAVS